MLTRGGIYSSSLEGCDFLNPQIVGRKLVLVFGQEHLVLDIVRLFFIAALMFSIDEVKCLNCCLYL